MKVSAAALALIKSFEGFRSRAYRDSGGVLTIGYGHTSMAGLPRVTPNLRITVTDAAHILERDVNSFATGVAALLKRPLTDDQFGALVSFAYNVGLVNFAKSSVLTLVNAGAFERMPRRLALWNKAAGQVLPGLVRRRAAEAALFMKDTIHRRAAPELVLPQAAPPPVLPPVLPPVPLPVQEKPQGVRPPAPPAQTALPLTWWERLALWAMGLSN